eukprot:TRINITY_DN1484_c0_g1_i1.p1 TRINITY_DN1484_c0_g1~~TRINITY_DN1484_c0_g1_i1.p1  ORF type:complete len:134 (+),score=34.57 TRINITY_DN1484_c0_g1_i1:94-495(+)
MLARNLFKQLKTKTKTNIDLKVVSYPKLSCSSNLNKSLLQNFGSSTHKDNSHVHEHEHEHEHGHGHGHEYRSKRYPNAKVTFAEDHDDHAHHHGHHHPGDIYKPYIGDIALLIALAAFITSLVPIYLSRRKYK